MKEIKQKKCKVCGKLFTPFKSTDKYCCYKCAASSNDFKLSKKTPIRSKSKSQSKKDRLYMSMRESFLNMKQNSICPVTGKKATEIHHTKGRVGDLYLNINYWLGVSREGHMYIHAHPDESYKKGWLVHSSYNN